MKNNTMGILLASFALAFSTNAALTPVDLRCDYAVNPLGVDSPRPELSWKLQGRERGQRQSAYEILAASSVNNLRANDGDLWDRGKVDSDGTIQIPFAGAEFESSQPVFWKVRVWDGDGKVSAWSRAAAWTMGVLFSNDWQAKWIGAADTNIPSLLLRREFSVRPGLKRALVNICGLGQYELALNGKKVGDDYLSPGWTDYRKTCLYDTFDVTKNLRRGKNAAGIFLGNGMYDVVGVRNRFTKFKGSFGPQKAIAQIRLEYADGSVAIIGTDDNWLVAPGPITFSSIYGGEDFDARRAQRGWDQPGFDDSKWLPAEMVGGPGGAGQTAQCAADS